MTFGREGNMKTLASMPLSRTLMRFFGKPAPVLVPVATDTYLRPVEIRRYLRNLRESRQYRPARDFFN
jgi:hypothetical protein